MDLNDLLSSLTEEDMKKLQETASQLLGNMSAGENVKSEDNAAGGIADLFSGNIQMPDPKLLSNLSRCFGKMNESDSRCDFLYALKPLLSENRRPKIDEAVNVLRVMKMMRMLKEGGLFG